MGPHVGFHSKRTSACVLANGLLDSARKPRPFVFALESVSLGFTLDLAPLGRSRLMIFVSLSDAMRARSESLGKHRDSTGD